VARIAGFPRHARMIGKALGRCPYPLPWHRVVRSDRTLALAFGSEAYERQKGLLEKEGAAVINGKVVPPESDENEGLDKLLWGPQGS